MAGSNPDDIRMTLGDHLEELRSRLFMGLIGPLIAAIVMLIFGRHIVAFLAQPALQAMRDVGLPPRMINPTFTSAFAVYLKVSLFGGLIVGIPWLVYQLWLFIAPGLYAKEQKLIRSIIPGSVVLMLTGVGFLYYILLPIMLWFLLNFAVSFDPPGLDDPPQRGDDANPGYVESPLNLPRVNVNPPDAEIGDAWLHLPTRELRVMMEGGEIWRVALAPARMMEPLIQLDQYISFIMVLALVFSLAFQLPLVMLVLGKVGLIEYEQFTSVRKHALLVIAVLSAMATPGDPFSMVGLMVPMYGLYELGILLVRWFATDEAARTQE